MVPLPGVESNGAVAGEGATSTVKQPLRVTCDLHHKFGELASWFQPLMKRKCDPLMISMFLVNLKRL